jgi:hypothetical protein
LKSLDLFIPSMQKVNFKIFSPSESDNPLSTTMDTFLRRQVYLEANCTVILHLKNELELSFSHMFEDSNDVHIFAGHTFETDPSNQEAHAELRDYLYMWQLVQSVENFESFLKTSISIAESLNKDNTILWEMSQTNKDRIKFLKTISPQIAQHLSTPRYAKIYETFLMCEVIRQITVHSNMIITDRIKSKLNVKSPLFKMYFDHSKNGNLNKVHPQNAGSCQQLMIKISELAYMMFQGLSSNYNLPIIEATFYLGGNQQ